jgi:hypothetical protein
MIQISARKAESTLAFDQRDPGAMPQMLAAFIAGRILVGDKDFQIHCTLQSKTLCRDIAKRAALQGFQQTFTKRGQADLGEFGKFTASNIFHPIFTFQDSKSNQGQDHYAFNRRVQYLIR